MQYATAFFRLANKTYNLLLDNNLYQESVASNYARRCIICIGICLFVGGRRPPWKESADKDEPRMRLISPDPWTAGRPCRLHPPR